MAGKPQKYTQEINDLIISLSGKSSKEMVDTVNEKFNLTGTVDTIRAQVYVLRRKGHTILAGPKGTIPKPEGDTRVRKVKGEQYTQQKKNGKWVTISRISDTGEPLKVRKTKKRKKVREQSKLHIRIPAQKKVEPVQMKTRVVDPRTLKSVRVDSKTIIQVNKSIPDQVAIDNWYAKREMQRAHIHG